MPNRHKKLLDEIRRHQRRFQRNVDVFFGRSVMFLQGLFRTTKIIFLATPSFEARILLELKRERLQNRADHP
ncbi:MAG: hypothetical protein BMS9Abin05_1257 [Rhodothermia bacterium]|nr:MAG: hypothetical protein BMS9Abin05_1257 [Rhodothermia bacterium]